MRPNRRHFLATSASLPLLAQPTTRRNLILITNDQHRADSLGCYGHPVVRTPNLDRLAAEGTRFTNHFVQAPQCVPSRASIHTGRYPHVHRTPSNAFLLPDSELTLARLLNQAGYITVAVGEMPFAPRSYTGGFSRILASSREYNRFLAQQGWAGSSVTAERRRQLDLQVQQSKDRFQAAAPPWPAELDETFFFADQACQFLREPHDQPFFLHLSIRKPHHPFDPPAPFDRMYDDAIFPSSHSRPGEMAAKPPSHQAALERSVGFDLRTMAAADLHRIKSFYCGMISLTDQAIGRVLEQVDRANLRDNTVVIFTSDHGEMLGDHGLLFKGSYMYDEVLRTPLIVRAPGLAPAGVKDALTEGIDIAPTALRLLGLPVHAGMQGADLFTPAKPKTAVFSEFPNIKSVRTRDWKLVHYLGQPYGELYDLRNDPHELTNLYSDSRVAARRAEMEAILSDWLIRSADPLAAPVRAPEEPV